MEPERSEPARERSELTRAAAIDVGSTSIHLLVGSVLGSTVEPVHEASAFLGLGSALEVRRVLGETALGGLIAAIGAFVDQAHRAGAEAVAVVATEPLRRALDAARIVRAVEGRCGVALHALTHREEALLTLLGVTGGRSGAHEAIVADVGGGSTEVLIARTDGPPLVVGLAVGAARLTDRLAPTDPPTAVDVTALLAAARRAAADGPTAAPHEVVAVGGTADNLLKLVPEGSGRLDRRGLLAALARLGAEPADVVAARYGMRPGRARLLPAGAAILLALLERYAADGLRVSRAGLREGTILAAARGGRDWRDGLERIATGSPPRGPGGAGAPAPPRPAKPAPPSL